MVSEESALDHAIEAAGLTVVETDLGEYILQINDYEPPSHIIGPALHKSQARRSPSSSTSATARRGRTGIDELCLEAREVLRTHYLTADMGISGGNFFVAETGSVVVVTNEGNATLTTTLPKVHVAISGIEKIVPTLEDVATLMRLLPRSATGQSISNYVDVLTGVKGAGEFHGAEHMYFIVVDAGRSAVLGERRASEALRCIRCGACMNHCPVYQNVGGHSYGWVYPGPIGSILTPMYVGLENALDLPQASTMCNQCGVVCPVKIPLPDLQRKLREQEFERRSAAVVRARSASSRGRGSRGGRRSTALATGIGVRALRMLARSQRHDPQAAARRRLDRRARHAGARGTHVPRALCGAPARHRATRAYRSHAMNAPHAPLTTVPRLSRRGESLGTENAFVVLAEVNALARSGKDIVSFCIGQPDFPTPRNIQDAAIAAIRDGKHGYTPSAGIDELRAAAARDLGARRGLDIRPTTSSSARARSRSLRTRSRRSPITAPATK